MKKLHWLGLICINVIMLASYSSAFAGNRAGAASFTLGAGYYYFADKRDLDNTGIPFAALGYDFTDQWGIEALLGIFNTDSHKPEDDGQQVNGDLFAIDGVYRFSPYNILEPFVLAGVGIIGLSPNGNDARNEGNINAGAGVEVFFDKSVAFRFEARDFYTMAGGKNDIFLDAGVTFLLDIC